MTYDEAKQKLDENRELLDIYRNPRPTKPAHIVVCSFVSALTDSRDFHELMFEAIHDRHLDNKEHLIELGLMNNSLIPMVVILMQGLNHVMSLEHYLEFLNAQNSQ